MAINRKYIMSNVNVAFLSDASISTLEQIHKRLDDLDELL